MEFCRTGWAKISMGMMLAAPLCVFSQDKPAAAEASPPAAVSPPAAAPSTSPSTPPSSSPSGAPGVAPEGHPFTKVKAGMNYTDAMAILGKPSAENAFCTGKQYIPFYGGKDKGRTNYYYKGHGVVVFHTEVSTFGIGGYVSCTPKTPLEVSEVLYDANEAGVVPKDGGEARK